VLAEFHQMTWDQSLEDDCRQLVRLAVREDLDRHMDLTTVALVDARSEGRAAVVARQHGVVCGLHAIPLALDEMEIAVCWSPQRQDGDAVEPAAVLGTLTGPARDLLTAERLLLNFVGRLSGVATLTRQYVQQVAGTGARIHDTRKTTPGWRRLEKYAVRCGGGCNHRTGLFDAVLIKDNHLAHVAHADQQSLSPAQAVELVRQRLREMLPDDANATIVGVEVDSLDQLSQVLPTRPDFVLLDKMSLTQLREAVALRDATGIDVELEASGGVNLNTVTDIARTGVDRISVGALTHSATALDVAMDWK